MSALWRAHIALFAVNVIYAANYIIAKGVMPDYVEPSGFILIRVTGAVSMFWIVKRFTREKVRRKHYGRLALCGLFGVCMNQLFFFEGLNLTSEVNAAIIMTITPILVLLLSAAILKERITPIKIVGILLGMIGAGSLIIFSHEGKLSLEGIWGDLFILINATSYGLYLVLVKPLMSKYKPITVISWVFLFGTVFVIFSPFALIDFSNVDWFQLPPWAIGSIIYVVIATTFLAYLLNIFALKIVRPTVSSSYIYLQPVMTGLFVWLFSAGVAAPMMFIRRHWVN